MIQIKSHYHTSITEREGATLVSYDPFSRLMKDRVIFLHSQVDEESSSAIIAQLLWLDSIDKSPISFYIKSPGGSISDGLAIADIISGLKSEVHTYAIGCAASMGAFLLSCGTKGHRYSSKNAEIMIHEPRLMGGGLSGTVTDIAIDHEHLLKTRRRLTKMLADNCGKDYDEVFKICQRDYWMDAEEALSFGIIDSIV